MKKKMKDEYGNKICPGCFNLIPWWKRYCSRKCKKDHKGFQKFLKKFIKKFIEKDGIL